MEQAHPLKIALIGKSGSGKTSATKILFERFGIEPIRTGAICRRIATILFGNDEKTTTQRLDDALTAIDESIFLRAALRESNLDHPYVIDSIRFLSDLALVRGMGCVILRVEANPDIRLDRLRARGQVFLMEENGNHRSESELDSAGQDFLVTNNSDLDSLEVQLARVVRELR